MSTAAAVSIWGTPVGAVLLDDGRDDATFEYDRDFVDRGVELAPLVMPLADRGYTFAALPAQTFHGLPGLLADSLPDRFGNALIDAWLASQGRRPGEFNAVERLCYTGTRGMGALEFAPERGPRPSATRDIDLDALVGLASRILTDRQDFATSLAAGHEDDALRDILTVGTSAGGARAKAVIAYNDLTGEVRSGQVDPGPGFEHWLLKFDGVSGNKDKEFEDPKGYGAIEYAYANMARAAGITMTECRLLEENGRRHFMTRRFDRETSGGKLHMQSLGALDHLDFNAAGAHSYEEALQVIRRLGLSPAAAREQFRRTVFNVVARNQDDHVKNIAFIMDRDGEWSLSPAFDVTYAYAPSGAWTSRHQMSINGKREGFTRNDLAVCAKTAAIKSSVVGSTITDVLAAVQRWDEFAAAAGVPDDQAHAIKLTHRLEIPPG